MLTEYAEIHISNSTKFKSAKKRILLTISTKSLFAADVGYQKFCYDGFSSPKWDKRKKANVANILMMNY